MIQTLCLKYGVRVIYPVVVGIETDEDALIVHGSNDTVMEMALGDSWSELEIAARLQSLFPDMKDEVLKDFLPILIGNQQHIREVRISGRPIAEAVHKEWVLGIGRGFDWLHQLNTAFIVGPFNPDLAGACQVAAGLLWDNIEAGRVDPEKGIVLLASSISYAGGGPEWVLAEEKVEYLAILTMDIIGKHVPQLKPYIQPLVGVVNMNTREFVRQPFEFTS